MTAREQAREAAKRAYVHGMTGTNNYADAASDVWEPYLQKIKAFCAENVSSAGTRTMRLLDEIASMCDEALGVED